MDQTRRDNPAVMGFDFQKLQSEMAAELGFSPDRIAALANQGKRQTAGTEAQGIAKLEEQSHSTNG